MKRTALFVSSLLLLSFRVFAQSPADALYPSRAVRLITPVASGGTGDVVARAVAKKLAETWGQPVVVDPRAGAGMIIATDLGAKAPPDGYTLLLVAASFSVNPSLQSKLPYDTLRDLAPITQTSFIPYVLVVHPTLPVRTVQELVAYEKAKPGTLNYGAAGTQNQLAMELLKLRTGARLVHVAYRSASLAITDLVAGHIQLALGSTLGVAPHVNSGRLRSVAVTSAHRASSMPDIPTIAESGVPGFDVSAWSGVVVPVGVPASVAVRLNHDIVSAVRSPELRDRLAADGGEAVGSSAEEFARFIRAEMITWAGVVKAAGLRPE
jgi:tripartite-type tricarboxylate transporter receptor subunit TctC